MGLAFDTNGFLIFIALITGNIFFTANRKINLHEMSCTLPECHKYSKSSLNQICLENTLSDLEAKLKNASLLY